MNEDRRRLSTTTEPGVPCECTDTRSMRAPGPSAIEYALRSYLNPAGERTDLLPGFDEPNRQQRHTMLETGNRPRQPLRFPVCAEPSPPAETLYPLQEWEGYVTEIRRKTFVARLLDLTAGESLPHETAWIPLAQVSERDAGRMRPGSVFRWVIGRRRDTAGTRRLVSVIVFRDLPVMTEAKLRDAEKWADKMLRAFAKEPGDASGGDRTSGRRPSEISAIGALRRPTSDSPRQAPREVMRAEPRQRGPS